MVFACSLLPTFLHLLFLLVLYLSVLWANESSILLISYSVCYNGGWQPPQPGVSCFSPQPRPGTISWNWVRLFASTLYGVNPLLSDLVIRRESFLRYSLGSNRSCQKSGGRGFINGSGSRAPIHLVLQ